MPRSSFEDYRPTFSSYAYSMIIGKRLKKLIVANNILKKINSAYEGLLPTVDTYLPDERVF